MYYIHKSLSICEGYPSSLISVTLFLAYLGQSQQFLNKSNRYGQWRSKFMKCTFICVHWIKYAKTRVLTGE